MYTQLIYNVQGMSCGSCVAKVQTALERHDVVESAEVNLEMGTAILNVSSTPGISSLQKFLTEAGNYTISNHIPSSEENAYSTVESGKETFKPLIVIFLYLIGVTALLELLVFEKADFMRWMRHFMAGFFLIFSFFKMLDIKAFSNSFAMYDVIAERSKFYALSYPFIELFLGLAYLTNIVPIYTNLVTLIVMGVGSIGVIRAVMRKDRIQCACLGTVFQLPMTTVTIIEDFLMVVMAAVMFWMHWH